MGWQVLSPFRGYANHQFTGGYDYLPRNRKCDEKAGYEKGGGGI